MFVFLRRSRFYTLFIIRLLISNALLLGTGGTPRVSAQSAENSLPERQTTRQQQAAHWINVAEEHHRQGQWAEAKRLLDQAIAAQHDLVNAYLLRAKVREQSGNLAGANSDYTTVIYLLPEHHEARFQRALVLLADERYPAARADLEFLLEHPSSETNAVYFRSEQRNNELLATGITTIQSNMRAEWLNAVGLTYYHEEAYAHAQEYFQQALAEDSDYVASYVNLGLAAEHQGDTTGAIAYYQNALSLEPGNAPALRNLTSLARVRNDAALLRQINEQSGGDSYESLLQRGITHLGQNDFTGAIAQFTQALELQPNNPEALLQRGFAYEKAELLPEALTDYSTVIASDPSAEKAYSNRGNVYFKRERYDQAVADYTQALVLNPTNDVALYNRAVAYQRLGQLTEACQDWQQAQTLGNTASPRPLAKLCEQ